jgi:antimicrobial peptide system SdpA family protein
VASNPDGKVAMRAFHDKRFWNFDPRSPTAMGGWALVHYALLGALAITAALAAMPFSTIQLPDTAHRIVMSLIPQGWGFFTKSPRDPEMHVATLRAHDLHELNLTSSFQPRYAFGFNRLARAQGLEIDALIAELPASSRWQDCQAASVDCARVMPVQARIVNRSRFPTLCGDLVLFERRPIPWAYRNRKLSVNMPSRLTRIEAVCSPA